MKSIKFKDKSLKVHLVFYMVIFVFITLVLLWLGNGFPNGNAFFSIPTEYKRDWANGVYNPDTGLVKFRNVGWFTNLDLKKRHEILSLYKNYNINEYPRYDNYDAIEVSKTAEIPYDYKGAMGVPITFLDKYNPEQFEIIKFRKGDDEKDLVINGKSPYFRILIKHKGVNV